ncbi:MAG: acylphosphatase [Saprospiraceae bacterium]|nr:acylphosphatase [Bacteroidia bacterium]NNL91779.1 acylphosphatase [Saprospiraceae bacterium]
MRLAFHIKVFGTVQGVGFRYYTKLKADELKVIGNVQNKSDGSVEINVSGSEDIVYSFLDWCHKGPASSFVSKLEYQKIDIDFPSNEFLILR